MIDLYQEFAELSPRDLAAIEVNQMWTLLMRVLAVYALAVIVLGFVWGWYVKRGRGGLDADRS